MLKINLKFFIVFPVFFLISLSCNWFEETKVQEITRGRLKFAQTLRYGKTGTHGGKGWYVGDAKLFVNDKVWSPDKMDVSKEIVDCEGSPNESLEILKCHSFANLKDTTYILRMTDNQPVWEIINFDQANSGKNFGEWVNDGKTLIFKDLRYQIETAEKIEIKGLPDYPRDKLRAVSPDLSKIVFQGDCFYGANVSEEVERRRKQICEKAQDYSARKIEILWVIEAATGETRFVELSREKYDWLIWNREKLSTYREWLNFYRQQLVWEKDKTGKYQLVSPK